MFHVEQIKTSKLFEKLKTKTEKSKVVFRSGGIGSVKFFRGESYGSSPHRENHVN